jgi:transcription elongation GreA/GreB family factor
MAKSETEKFLVVAKRKEIFLALVEAQDVGDNVLQSRKTVAERFAISEGRVRRIEQEGIDACWPPLE